MSKEIIMMKHIGRKIYYDVMNGNILVIIPEGQGYIQETTMDEDFKAYKSLNERKRDTVGVIQLEYGQFSQDFRECNGCRINPDTLELEFRYPDTNAQDEPEYQKSLSEEVNDLNKKIDQQNQAIADLTTMIAMIQTP